MKRKSGRKKLFVNSLKELMIHLSASVLLSELKSGTNRRSFTRYALSV
jgi:hypothetical protein